MNKKELTKVINDWFDGVKYITERKFSALNQYRVKNDSTIRFSKNCKMFNTKNSVNNNTKILLYGEETETGLNIYEIQLEEPITEETKNLVIKNTAKISLVINGDTITCDHQNKKLPKRERMRYDDYAINDTIINFFTNNAIEASDFRISQPSVSNSFHDFIRLMDDTRVVHIKRVNLTKTNFSIFMNKPDELIIKDTGFRDMIKIINLTEHSSHFYKTDIINGFHIRVNRTSYGGETVKNEDVIDKNSFKGTYLEAIPKKHLIDTINKLNDYPYAEKYIKALINESISDWHLPEEKDDLPSVDAVIFVNKILNSISEAETHFNLDLDYVYHLFNEVRNEDARFMATLLLNRKRIISILPNDIDAKESIKLIADRLRNAGKTIKHIIKNTPDMEKLILRDVCCYDNRAFKAFAKRIFKELKLASGDYETALYLSLFFNENSSLKFVFNGKDKDGKPILNAKRTLSEIISLANDTGETAAFYDDPFNELIRLYNDTLRMGEILINEKIIESMPVSVSVTKIQDVHDLLTKIFNQHKMQIDKAKFKKAKDSYKTFLFKDENFVLRLPETNDDLVREGATLNHCVASYTNAFMENRSAILFIRRNDAPDEPYYTMEVCPKTNHIVQVRGKHNAPPTKEIDAFVKKIKEYYQTNNMLASA